MKKITLLTSLIAIGFAFPSSKAQAQASTPFEGVISYSIDASDPQASAMMGSSVTLYIKGDKTKQVKDGMFTQMSFEDINKPNNPVVLITAAGNKYLLKNDTTKKDTATPVIKYVDGTQKIAGYVCNKAEITTTIKGQATAATVYYTPDIVTNSSKAGPFKGLKGFPLEYSFSIQGVKITFTATKVKQQSLTDDTFVPHTSGYKLMSEDEINADVMQKMQSGN